MCCTADLTAKNTKEKRKVHKALSHKHRAKTMKKLFYSFLLISTFLNAQHSKKLYFGRGHNYSTVYSYFVAEILILNDTIFTRFDYKLPNIKEWKNYKKYKPTKETRRISKKGNFYVFIDSINRTEIFEMHCLKISKKKIVYYSRNPNGNMEKENLVKGFTFRRKK